MKQSAVAAVVTVATVVAVVGVVGVVGESWWELVRCAGSGNGTWGHWWRGGIAASHLANRESTLDDELSWNWNAKGWTRCRCK